MILVDIFQKFHMPVLDYISLFFTCFGSELFFLCVSSVIFWCFSKKAAYKLVFSFVLFGPVVYIANLIVRQPFPFSKGVTFSLPQIIRAHATGYSVPSIGIFIITVLCAGIFINNSFISVKICCAAASVLTALSYIYLGLCGAWSAALSMILGAGAAVLFTKFADGMLFDIRQYPVYLVICAIPTFVLVVVSVSMYLNGIISLEAFSGALRVSGMNMALLVSWFFESNFIRFSIRCDRAGKQFLKAVTGSASTLLTWFALYIGFNFIPGFWPAAFICNIIVSLGAFAAFPIFIRGIFESSYR